MPPKFSNWIALMDFNLSALAHLHPIAAVYALRCSQSEAILKFGETGNLRQRVIRNYIAGVGGGTTKRIHKILFSKSSFPSITSVDIAWVVADDKIQAKRWESEHLDNFRQSNSGNSPPWEGKNLTNLYLSLKEEDSIFKMQSILMPLK